ncbi:MAG: S1 RNA-binding domain-containing protein [Candidatus Marsarchaeota archaeon]|nr:S1 RNA-binding domain-containing protein [Candidatus Marsarchaeota archaeon]
MVQMPETDELVLATIKKILPYGAFCGLDEYRNGEAFMHISEVAPRWIKNIHEFLHEGQHMVAKVYHVDVEKGQVDISLKRVSEAERKRKLESVRRDKRGAKLLELAVKEAKSTAPEAQAARLALEDKYGELMEAFEQLAKSGPAGLEGLKLEKGLAKAVLNVAGKSIRTARAELNAIVQLTAWSSDGVVKIKQTLGSLKVPAGCTLSLHYLGAPRYQIGVVAGDYKEAQKGLDGVQEQLQLAAKKLDMTMEWAVIEE